MNNRTGIGEIPQNLRPERNARSGRSPERKKNYIPVVRRGRFASQISQVNDSSSKPVLNQNDLRNYLVIQNNGATDVFINFGNKATTGNIRIIAGGNYEPLIAPTNSIYLVSNTGQTNLCAIVEGVEV